VDVIAWPGEEPGPLQWKVWRVTSSEPMRSVTLTLPPGAVRRDALHALISMPQGPEGATAGAATVTIREASDLIGTTTVALPVGECAGGAHGQIATMRFESGGMCTTIAFDASGGGVAARIDFPAVGVIAVDLRLDSLQTPAGRLLPANPADPATADTSVIVETAGGTAQDTVREISGGTTSLTVGADAAKVDYGHTVTLSGRVLRGGVPAVGEPIALGELYGSVANTPIEPHATTTPGADGRFAVTVRPSSTARWAAWSQGAATANGPRLNTLAGVVASDVIVRAPKPTIELRHATRPRRQLVHAEIVVRNPIRRETLQCRLYVAGKQLTVRHFPFRPGPLVFHVTGHPTTKVRAVVGRWRPPVIAPRSSRVITLWPTKPRRP
jgi:hypothetical protein